VCARWLSAYWRALSSVDVQQWTQGWSLPTDLSDDSSSSSSFAESPRAGHVFFPPPLALPPFSALFGSQRLGAKSSSSSSSSFMPPSSECESVAWRYLCQAPLRWQSSVAHLLPAAAFPTATALWWSPDAMLSSSSSSSSSSLSTLPVFPLPPPMMASAVGLLFPADWLSNSEGGSEGVACWQWPSWRIDLLPPHVLFALRAVFALSLHQTPSSVQLVLDVVAQLAPSSPMTTSSCIQTTPAQYWLQRALLQFASESHMVNLAFRRRFSQTAVISW
jgi:hypothetical protein